MARKRWMSSNMTTRTRFAPSPTGYLHIGSLRTALYCYLWAKKENGQYILRIEDTDQNRYVEGSVENLIRSLEQCSLIHDEGPTLKDDTVVEIGEYGPYFQSNRLSIYQKYVKQLIDEGKAYYCFCTKDRLDALREEQTNNKQTPKYDSHCSHLTEEEIKANLEAKVPYVIRMKLPKDREVVFDDAVRGRVSINTNDIDEQVLIKADGFPTYHFAVVVDDHLMNITHVIRGEEWLVSTPKHILLFEALGWEAPKFVHLPTVLNPNKKKLSKRDGSAAVGDFIELGYLPNALINYITLLGWSAPDDKEIFTLDEIAQEFDLSRINKSGAVFDVEKLNWVNSQYIKQLSTEELAQKIKPFLLADELITENEEVKLLYIAECIKDRIHFLKQASQEVVEITKDRVISDSDDVKEVLAFETNAELYSSLIELVEKEDCLTPENINAIFKVIQKEKKIKGKNLFMGTRVAITGEVHGADIKYTMAILGKDEVLSRLKSM